MSYLFPILIIVCCVEPESLWTYFKIILTLKLLYLFQSITPIYSLFWNLFSLEIIIKRNIWDLLLWISQRSNLYNFINWKSLYLFWQYTYYIFYPFLRGFSIDRYKIYYFLIFCEILSNIFKIDLDAMLIEASNSLFETCSLILVHFFKSRNKVK